MTREEAIQVLNMVEAHGLADEAKRMAIEALSADTVSREAHYDAVANIITDMEERGFVPVVWCKDCTHRHTDDCPMYHEECYEIDEGGGYFDSDFTVHDYSKDSDFCSRGERKGGAE